MYIRGIHRDKYWSALGIIKYLHKDNEMKKKNTLINVGYR